MVRRRAQHTVLNDIVRVRPADRQGKIMIDKLALPRRLCAFAVCLVMLLPLAAGCTPQPGEPGETLLAGLSVQPQNEDDAGVAYDSGFYIRSKRSISSRELKKSLTVEPELEYELSAAEDGGFFLKPEQPLTPDTVYAFTYTDAQENTRAWAFQSRRPFRVVSASIEQGASDVDVYSGLELTFSHPDVDVSDYLEVSPKLDYTLERMGRMVRLYPQEGYKPLTPYTVTIKSGLKSPLGDILPEDYTLTFTTANARNDRYRDNIPFYLYGDYSETFLPQDTPVVEVGLGSISSDAKGLINPAISVSVSRFKASEAYMQAIAGRDAYAKDGQDVDQYRCPKDALTHFASFDTQVFTNEQNWGTGYVVFPEKLPKGWYAADITAELDNGDTYTIQKLLQISEVSVYTQSVNGQTLVWLNNAQTQNGIAQASVGLLKDATAAPAVTASTDANGLAQLATGDLEYGYLYAKADTENEYVERIPLAKPVEQTVVEKYYSFLFTDREIYQPSDTVHVWGRLSPRKDGVSLPKALTLRLLRDPSERWDIDEMETITQVPVTLEQNGTFSAQLSFESLSSDGYYLSLTDDQKNEYYFSYLSIYEYEKPEYKLTSSSKKDYYTASDAVEFNVAVSFYNGTPVPGMTFETNINGASYSMIADSSGNAPLTLNQDGHFFDEYTSWQPYELGAYVYSTGAEDQQYFAYPSALVYPRDVMLLTEHGNEGFSKTITLFTNKIKTGGLKDTKSLYRDYIEDIKGEAVNIPVDISIYRVEYDKKLVRSYYDPVNKMSMPVYNYTRKEMLENQYTVNTVGGTATLSDLPNPQSNEQSYRIQMSYKDTTGRAVTQDEYINYYQERYYSTQQKTYRFVNDKTESADRARAWYDSLGYSAQYALGETVSISLQENGVKASGGRLLYTLVQDGVKSFAVAENGTFSFAQSEQYIPNMQVIGAYFDGTHIYPVNPCSVTFDTSQRALTVEVQPDREQYRPGDKVTLELTAKDAQGRPAAADIAVSVVDEALFALADQSVTPLAGLYSPIYYPTVEQFASYNQYNFDGYDGEGGKGGGGPETGGGGDREQRDNFLDTAAFLTAVTDKNGKARLSFSLPDNLTSWRITTAAITTDLQAGATVTNISTQLPLFVSAIYNTVYIEGDSVAFLLRAYGDSLSQESDVTYTAVVSDAKKRKEEKTATQKVQQGVAYLDFGMLAAGDYKVTFRAQSGDERDAVEYPFTVKKSALELSISREITPEQASSLTAEKYPVWLGFYDKQYAEYIKTIEYLASQYGDRSDQRTASVVATALLKEYADDDEKFSKQYDDRDTELAVYQKQDGGIRVYTYDYPDVQLTARMATAAGDRYNAEATRQYLDRYLNYSWYEQTEVCAAIMGLAVLKQPVLTDAKIMIKRAQTLTDLDILYLCVALSYLGDEETAVQAYNTYIAPKVKRNDYWSYYDSSMNKKDASAQDEAGIMQESGKGGQIAAQSEIGANLQHTALLLLLAQKTGCADADALVRYARENSAYDISVLPELTAYVTHFMPSGNDTAVVRFNRFLLPTTLELKKGGIRYVPFTKNQLIKSNIAVTGGEVGITAHYTGMPDALANTASSDISITKAIARKGGGLLKVGDLAEITLTVTMGENAPTGLYNVNEWVPSSLRYQSVVYPIGINTGGIWINMRESQRMRLAFYHQGGLSLEESVSGKRQNTYSVTYYARCVAESDSAVDSTYVVHAASGAFNATPKSTLPVAEGAKSQTLSSSN